MAVGSKRILGGSSGYPRLVGLCTTGDKSCTLVPQIRRRESGQVTISARVKLIYGKLSNSIW